MSYKQSSIRNLKDFKEVADELKLSFCLMDGTLLGAYRDGDFCQGDTHDVDLGILSEYYGSVNVLVERLKERGFTSKIFKISNKLESYSLHKNGSRIDIARINTKGNKCYNLFRGEKNGKENRQIMAYIYPAKCFDKFQQLEFQGMKFNIPDKVEDYLSVRYVDWKTPVRHKDYNFLDVKQCPCLIKYEKI